MSLFPMTRRCCLALRMAMAMAMAIAMTLLLPGLPAHAQVAAAAPLLDTAALGLAPLRKPLRSFRDLRFADVMRQRYDFSCGSAALATLLHYGYGLKVSETGLIKEMLVGADPDEVRRNGFSMLDMKRLVGRLGMRAHGYRIEPQALYRLQMPVIALLDSKGYKHFVLVKGASSGRVFVADPALGHRVLFERDFVAGWNGIVLAVIADRPLLASRLTGERGSYALQRRLYALEYATTPPPVVELGLVHADLL